MRITISKRVAIFLSLVIFCLIIIFLLEIFRVHLGQNLTDALQTLDSIIGIVAFVLTIILWIADYFETSQLPTGIKSFDYLFPEIENELPKLLREPLPFRVDFEKNYVVLPKNICSLLVKKLGVKFKKHLTVANNTETKKKLSQAVIAGPSGCGKTTTCLRFANDLSVLGWKVYYLDTSQSLDTNLIAEIIKWLQTLRASNLLIIDNVHTRKQEAILLLDAIEQISSLRFRAKLRILYIETIAHTISPQRPDILPKMMEGKRVSIIPTETGTQIGFNLTNTYSPEYHGLLGRKPGILVEQGKEIAHTLFQRFVEIKEIEEAIDFSEIFEKVGNVAEFCEVLRWIEVSLEDDDTSLEQIIPPNLPQFTLNRHLEKVRDRELGVLCLGLIAFFTRMGSAVMREFIENRIGKNVQNVVDNLVESQLIREVFVGPLQKQFLILTQQSTAELLLSASASMLQENVNLDDDSNLDVELIHIYLDYLRTIPQRISAVLCSAFLLVLSTFSVATENEALVDIIIDQIESMPSPDSNIVYSLHNLSTFYLRDSNYDEAEKLIRQALEIDHHFYQGRSNLGIVLLLKGKFNDARTELENSRSQNNNSTTLANLAITHWELGNKYQAIDFMKDASELEPTTARYLFQLGLMQFEATKSEDSIEEAISNMKRAIELEPDDDVNFYSGLSHVFVSRQRYSEAESIIQKAESRGLESPALLNNKGSIMKSKGENEDAKELFERALQLNPGFVSAHLNLCSYYLDQNDIGKSVFHLEEARKSGDIKENANFHAMDGQLLHRQGKYKESIDPFEKSIELGMEKPEIYLNLSIAYHELNNPKLARQKFLHVSKIMGVSSKSYFQYLAFLLSKGYKSEVKDYTMTFPIEIRKTSDFMDNLESFLDAILRKGFFEIVERCLDYSTKEKTNAFLHWFNLGAVCINLGKYAKAKNAIQEAIKLNPNSPHAWDNLGRVHHKLGELIESQKAFDKAKALAEEIGDNQLIFDPDKGWHIK